METGGDPGPEFSDQMETAGTITCVASDAETVVVTGISDATEPYFWSPPNQVDVAAFADHIAGLADQSLTVTLNDNAPVVVVPSFADNTGDAQSWTQDTAIAAHHRTGGYDGTPAPTYAAVGALPAGIAFNTST